MTDLTARQSARKFNAAKTIYVVGSLAAIGIVVVMVAMVLVMYVLGRVVPDSLASATAAATAFMFGKVWGSATSWLE